MTGPRVLLMTLSVRTSAKGNTYLSGWLGKASLVAFAGEPDKFGNETWDVYLSEPEPRQDRPAKRSEAATVSARPPPVRRFRREGARARQERVSAEIARSYGLGDGDPNDDLPF